MAGDKIFLQTKMSIILTTFSFICVYYYGKFTSRKTFVLFSNVELFYKEMFKYR